MNATFSVLMQIHGSLDTCVHMHTTSTVCHLGIRPKQAQTVLHTSACTKDCTDILTLSMCQEDQLARTQLPLNALTQAHIRPCHGIHHAVCAALCRLFRLLIAPAPVPTVDMDQLLRYGETMGPL